MCILVGTGLQAIGSEIRVVMCQVGLWYKIPHSSLTHYLARIVFLKETTTKETLLTHWHCHSKTLWDLWKCLNFITLLSLFWAPRIYGSMRMDVFEFLQVWQFLL